MGRIVRTPFGVYEVMSSYALITNHASRQVTQQELDQLERAWSNIHNGIGMNIQVDPSEPNPMQARNQFDNLLIDGMTHSEAFRNYIISIGQNPDPSRPQTITIILGHNWPDVVVDEFDTNRVDLRDIHVLPADPRPGHPNEVTRREMVLHFLAERYFHMAYNLPFHFDRDEAAHRAGIAAQNQLRTERHQVVVDRQTREPHVQNRLNIHFRNHTSEIIMFKPGDHSLEVIPPVEKQHHGQSNPHDDVSTHLKSEGGTWDQQSSASSVQVPAGDQPSYAKTVTADSWDPSRSDDTGSGWHTPSEASQGGHDLGFDPSTKSAAYATDYNPGMKTTPHSTDYDYDPSTKSTDYGTKYDYDPSMKSTDYDYDPSMKSTDYGTDLDYDPSTKSTAYNTDYDPSKVISTHSDMSTGGGTSDYSGAHDAKPDSSTGDGTTDWWGQKH